MKSYLSLIPISAKVHKRQHRMTLLCIIFAVFLVTAVFSMADMAVRMEKIRAGQKHGNWHVMLRDLPRSTFEEIAGCKDIETACQYNTINHKINEAYDIGGKKTAVCGADEAITDILPGFSEGGYPQSSTEVMLTANAKTELGIQIGDHVTLNTPSGSVTYQVSGFNTDISYVMQFDSIVAFVNPEAFGELYEKEHAQDAEYVYYLRFKNHTNIPKAIAQIKEQYHLTDEQISQNALILGLLGYSDNSYILGLYLVAAVLFLLIMAAGIFMIAGSINSNVAERSRFFGMLRCTGASKSQIRRYVRLEALNWCRSAIPAGILSGVMITWVLCALLRVVSSEFEYLPVFGVSSIGIISGILVGIFTVLIAAQAPAGRAAKVSPAAAVSGSKTGKSTVHRSVRTGFLKIDTALGIHHAVSAKKNLFLMTGSFALSIILFLSFSVVVDWTRHALNPLRPYAPDFSVASADRSCSVERELADEISNVTGVKRVFGRMYENVPARLGNNSSGTVDLISYEAQQFEWAKADMADGDITRVFGDSPYAVGISEKSNPVKVGDKVQLEGGELEIACVLTTSPFSEIAGTPTVICSEETFTRLTGRSDYSIIDVQFTKDATDESVSKIRSLAGDSCEFSDRRLSNRETQSTYWAFSLFVYGFLAVIALITVFNIVNSISMSVSAKLRQYGAMRAVGMDGHQITKMIAAEAATYAVTGSITGSLIGLPLHKFLFDRMITSYFGSPWTMPFASMAVIVLLVALSCVAAVYAPAKRIRNMAVTDTINEL
ncbi:MAG: ABC transporter permease [Clostridiales bacterium]|nr:ABC transporter permease [Clostridiales bacterium]